MKSVVTVVGDPQNNFVLTQTRGTTTETLAKASKLLNEPRMRIHPHLSSINGSKAALKELPMDTLPAITNILLCVEAPVLLNTVTQAIDHFTDQKIPALMSLNCIKPTPTPCITKAINKIVTCSPPVNPSQLQVVLP